MELQSTTNFSMLTEHLHILFKSYITDGRMRAPPEFELRDMIPTFQQGAKTHRRALQSKFKSWARRMTVLNSNLVLSSSGKIIVPQERCEEIVMELHRDNHMSINKVITQIQKKYSWTKKNFGMDVEVVMNVICNNCKSAACQKEIRKVTKTYFKRIHWIPASNVSPRQFYQDSNVNYADFYNSMEISPRDGISAAEYPILQTYLSNRHNTLEVLPERVKNRVSPLTKLSNNENYKKMVLALKNKQFTELSDKNRTQHENAEPKVDISGNCIAPQSANFIENQRNKSKALWTTVNSGKKQCFPKSLDTRGEKKSEKVNFLSPLSVPSAALRKNDHNFTMGTDDSRRNSYSFINSCKKPRNVHEFKKQLKDAQIYPEIYPATFTDPKTLFLSSLGLVPKLICSKRILTKFTKEQRKKRLLEKRRSWFIGERKVLRDRNKLNKRNSKRFKMRYEACESLPKSHSSSFYHSTSRNSPKINDNFKKLKNIAKRPLRGHIEKPRIIKPKLILPKNSPETKEKDPEIIDIASSDDEGPVFQNFRDAKFELSEPQIQSASAYKQNNSSQYADPRLFGCNAENEEAVRNQMFYEQNFGYNGMFGAPNLFFSQSNVINFPVTSSNPSYQLNNSFYFNSQTQFPMLRPFLIPALSNSDIGVMQAGNFPMIKPLKPISSPNVSPYFKNLQPLPKSTNSHSGQSENSADDEQCLSAPNGNVADGNKESSTNINPVPHQASQPPTDFKVFLVNKTPKKTYLIVPPNCAFLNTAKKIIPILDRNQPIAPRINGSEKMPIKYKSVAKELQHRRLNNALFANVNYSRKQKEAKRNIQSEMARLSNWISKIKSSFTPANFHRGVEKFSHRLTNQLNVGITLVKGVRNALIEIEKNGENIAGDEV